MRIFLIFGGVLLLLIGPGKPALAGDRDFSEMKPGLTVGEVEALEAGHSSELKRRSGSSLEYELKYQFSEGRGTAGVWYDFLPDPGRNNEPVLLGAYWRFDSLTRADRKSIFGRIVEDLRRRYGEPAESRMEISGCYDRGHTYIWLPPGQKIRVEEDYLFSDKQSVSVWHERRETAAEDRKNDAPYPETPECAFKGDEDAYMECVFSNLAFTF